MNKLSDKSIKLIEKTHQYVLATDPNIEFTSVTKFIKYFFKQFDSIGIANKLTSTNIKYLNMTPQELVEVWNKKGEAGTVVHSEIEKYIKENSAPSNPKSKLAVEWIKQEFIDDYDVLSEVIVYSKELKLAGTIDILLHDRINDTYKIFDWKTSERINTTSFNFKMGTHSATSNLMDCNYNHYALQLSMYQYLLESSYNLNITERAIIHLDKDCVTTYKTDYLKNEIENMFKADRIELKAIAENSLTKEFVN